MSDNPIRRFQRYGCPVCPKRFSSLAVKKQHVKTSHPRPKK